MILHRVDGRVVRSTVAKSKLLTSISSATAISALIHVPLVAVINYFTVHPLSVIQVQNALQKDVAKLER
jgi:hypothetical protein